MKGRHALYPNEGGFYNPLEKTFLAESFKSGGKPHVKIGKKALN
jgi:hypothetical protein